MEKEFYDGGAPDDVAVVKMWKKIGLVVEYRFKYREGEDQSTLELEWGEDPDPTYVDAAEEYRLKPK